MALTYKIRGTDGKEYGPVALDQIQGWLREGRVNGETQMTRSDIDYWVPAGQFTELQLTPPPLAPAPATGAYGLGGVKPQVRTVSRGRGAATWFYYIAGLSVLNSLLSVTNSGWVSLFGLGIITQVFQAWARNSGVAPGVVLLLGILAAGVFVVFGVFAQKGQSWAFLVGMIAYAFDALLLISGSYWLSVAFHAYVLYRLFTGYQQARAAEGN